MHNSSWDPTGIKFQKSKLVEPKLCLAGFGNPGFQVSREGTPYSDGALRNFWNTENKKIQECRRLDTRLDWLVPRIPCPNIVVLRSTYVVPVTGHGVSDSGFMLTPKITSPLAARYKFWSQNSRLGKKTLEGHHTTDYTTKPSMHVVVW